LTEEIFMEQSEGFGAEDSSKVCKLVKSLYGLKQAPREWHAKIDGFLVGVLGVSRSVSDECFYVRIQAGIIAIIALYVDDLLIACNNIGILNESKEGLLREFEMKDMGQARMCLGFHIFRNRSERKLILSQGKYALSMLSRLECRTQMGFEHQWKSVLMWMTAANLRRMLPFVRQLAV
jgi:hypothetical protein